VWYGKIQPMFDFGGLREELQASRCDGSGTGSTTIWLRKGFGRGYQGAYRQGGGNTQVANPE